ncbi:MAG: thioesterase family protein [Chloroflexota bacterium]
MTKRSDYPFSYTLRVRYSEIDAQSVVYNSHFVTYFDITITEYLRHLNYDYSIEAMRKTGKDFHTVKVVVDYAAPGFYDDQIHVHIRAGRVGRSSIQWQLAIFRNDEDEPITTGEVVWVYADMAAHKSEPLPEILREMLLEG